MSHFDVREQKTKSQQPNQIGYPVRNVFPAWSQFHQQILTVSRLILPPLNPLLKGYFKSSSPFETRLKQVWQTGTVDSISRAVHGAYRNVSSRHSFRTTAICERQAIILSKRAYAAAVPSVVETVVRGIYMGRANTRRVSCNVYLYTYLHRHNRIIVHRININVTNIGT